MDQKGILNKILILISAINIFGGKSRQSPQMEIFGTVLEFSIWDWLLLVALIYLLYRIVIVPRFQRLRGDDDEVKPIPKLAPMRKQG